MAVCLDYQSVYVRQPLVFSVRIQLIVAIALLAVLVAKVWVRVECIDLGYQLAAEKDIALEHDLNRRELEFKLSVLKRPDNLAARATDRLGFERIRPTQARRIEG
jgi:hypothetical protein